MQRESNPPNLKRVKGWIFDVYPSAVGQMSVWIIVDNGQRIRLIDKFNQRFYVSGEEEGLEKLFYQFFLNKSVVSCRFVHKYLIPTPNRKARVLEITVEDYRRMQFFFRRILRAGRYLRYQLYNCDLKPAQAYLYEKDIFPLAFVEVEVAEDRLRFTLLDSVESTTYLVPPLRITRVSLEINKRKKIARFSDPLKSVALSSDKEEVLIDSGEEKNKLLQLVQETRRFDPDILLTKGGDCFIFPYLAKRALVNNVSSQFILSREEVPLVANYKRGKSCFSYGRTYYRSPTRRLYGRVHVDENNTFVLRESGIDGLIEIARTCRVPLHRASRSSIGTNMSSLQYYQATKDEFLIPRNKFVAESFKSAYELLVGDRGGFVYEPRMGIHEGVSEVDFSSLYPSVMAKYNISAETLLCDCCPDSKLRFPELDYHICEKRRGIIAKVLEFVVEKRLCYKRLAKETVDEPLRQVYDRRQGALKWILVTCFGYLGYRNAKFGTVDGHMGVCAFGRQALLKAAHIAEMKGFNVIHGIVDSLWLKKKSATSEEYTRLCDEVSNAIGVPLAFEGCYKWIVFLPSKLYPNVPVLNRYYGVKKDSSIKVRGLEVRRRDTPKFVCDAQMEMINVLSSADDSASFVKKIPDALKVIKDYRKRLLDGKVAIWDLIITKRLSKEPENYTQKISQLIAAEQLIKEGVEISAGKNVRFLFTSAENKRYDRRVKAEELIDEKTSADTKKYLLLLYSAASNLLSPFGYSSKIVYDHIRGYRHVKLASF